MTLRTAAAFLVVSFAALPARVGAPQSEQTADRILEKAIARGEHADELIRARWNTLRYRLRTVIEKLDGAGDVDKREESVVDVYPIEGVPYSRFVAIHGQPLTEAELEGEDERERQFRLEQKNKTARDQDAEGDEEERLVFDATVIERFVFAYEGEEELEGRRAHILRFEPSGKKPPARSRIEAAVNKTEGRIWIDRDTFEVQKIQFTLREKVKILWGIAGYISKLEGTYQRKPLVKSDLWAPWRLSLTMDGRKLFRSLRLNQLMEWSEYREERE